MEKGLCGPSMGGLFKIFLNRIDQFISEEQKNLIRKQTTKPQKPSKPHHLMHNILSGNAAKCKEINSLFWKLGRKQFFFSLQRR